jgi:hypothetical protein
MERPPTPVCRCFILCRGLFADPARQEYVIVCPDNKVFPRCFPVTEDFSVFARFAFAQGYYAVEVQLRNLEGEVLSRCKPEETFEALDPFAILVIPLHHLPIEIPAPGKYEVALLANGQEVASDTLQARRFRGRNDTDESE